MIWFFAAILIVLPICIKIFPRHTHQWSIASYDITEVYKSYFAVSCITYCSICKKSKYHEHKSVEFPLTYGFRSSGQCDVWIKSLITDGNLDCISNSNDN